MTDATLSTLSHSNAPEDRAGAIADELILVLECDRPMAGSARHRLDGIDEAVIGRGARRAVERSDCRLSLDLPDRRVSTQHASLSSEGAQLVLRDLDSKNGVSVNGARVSHHVLRDGDVIECGRTFFRYRMAVSRPAGEPLDVDCGDATALAAGLVTFYEPLARQLRTLAEIASSSLPVLILGPSGTGKELVARAIHSLSQRPGAFVGVNCGALPENLVEAELFGARRGAYTGAAEDRTGLVRASHQGTLFLDEVGELPTRAQPTLLRTLQEHEVLAVGATRPVDVDLRLVTATHRKLDALVQREQFRTDLLARISGVVLELPPLRERIDDVGIIIAALLARHTSTDNRVPIIGSDAMRLILRYSWPLNIRELEHALRAALALSPERIDVEQLPAALRGATAPAQPSPAAAARRWTPEQEARRAEVAALLVEHRGNVSEVARRMGKDRVQIRRWIKLFGLSLDELVK